MLLNQNFIFERVCIIYKFGHIHIREMASDFCYSTCDGHVTKVLSTAIVTVCKRLIVLEDKKRILITKQVQLCPDFSCRHYHGIPL